MAPLIAIAVLIAIFLAYYYVVIERREASANDQAFRALAAMKVKLADLVNTYSIVFQRATREYARPGKGQNRAAANTDSEDKRAPKILDFLTAQGSKLADVNSCASSPDAVPIIQAKRPVTANAVPSSNGYSVELASDGWCAHISIEDALLPLITESAAKNFDDIILADSSGAVLYQTQRSGIVADNLSFLRTSVTKSTRGSSSTSEATRNLGETEPASSSNGKDMPESDPVAGSTVVTVPLAGTKYRAYLVPVRLPVPRPSVSGTGTGARFVLCGLILDEHFAAKSRSVPLTVLTAIGLAVLLVIVGTWPVLKFSTMRRTEPITRWAGLVYSLSTTFTLILVVLLVIHLYYGFSDPKTDNNMEDLAKAINRNLGQEIRQALLVMQSVEASSQLKNAQVLKHLPQASCADDSNGGEPHHLTELLSKLGMEVSDYPYFRRLYVFDGQGFEHISWTVDATAPPALRVCDRPYFRGVERNDLWYFSDQGLYGSRFRVDPLYSKSTGEYLAAIARPYTIKENGKLAPFGHGVMAMITPLMSVINPVLPPDYGFAVIDPDGEVLFHSDATKNGRENLFDELVDSRALRAASLARRPTWLRERYLGEDYGFFVTSFSSIQGCPWSLVVFSNRAVLGDKALQRTLLVALLCGMYFVLLAAGIGLMQLILPCRRMAWPVDRMKGRYCHLAFVLGFVTLLSYVLIFKASPQWLLCLIVLVPVSAVAFSILKLRGFTTGITWVALFFASASLFALAATAFSERGSWKVSPYLPLFLIFVSYLSLRDETLPDYAGTWKWPSLASAYTAASLALLVMVAVIPCIGFFRFSYDYHERLATRRQQLLTLEALSARERRIVDRYFKVTISGEDRPFADDLGKWLFLRRRLQEQKLDLYDQAFRDQSAGQITLGHGLPTWPRWLSYVVTHWIPDRADSLKPLVADDCIAGSKWLWNDAGANRIHIQPSYVPGGALYASESCECKRSCGQNAIEMGKKNDDLAKNNGSPETVALHKLASQDPKFLVQDLTYHIDILRSWDFLRLTIFVLIVLLVVMFLAFRSALTNMFLLKWKTNSNGGLGEPPDEWHRDQWLSITLENAIAAGNNSILVGPPASNKTQWLADHAKNAWNVDMSNAPQFLMIPAGARIAVLDHFEHEMGQRSVMRGKLRILEQLLHAQITVLIITTVDPAFYLKEMGQDSASRVVGVNSDDQDQERWTYVLGRFDTFRLLPVSNPDTSRAYYPLLWSSCTFSEKVGLYGLAQDGWPNHKNYAALHHLWNRGLIAADPALHIADQKLKKFISGRVTEPERQEWTRRDTSGIWEGLRTTLIIIFLASLAALLFFSQKDVLGIVTAAIGALTGAAKIIADVRGIKTGGSKGGAHTA
jgi:hypothetical protein